jgi:hypothetical protein
VEGYPFAGTVDFIKFLETERPVVQETACLILLCVCCIFNKIRNSFIRLSPTYKCVIALLTQHIITSLVFKVGRFLP